MNRFLLLIALVSLLTACRSTRQIGTAISKKDTVGRVLVDPAAADSMQVVRGILRRFDSNLISYTTFNGKLGIDYRGGDGKNYDVNASIRMYKDSAIWISANAVLGIEAMRVLVTKDSVKMLDKLNKVYTARSIDYIQEVTSLPLDLYTLQELIIGNPVFLDTNVVAYAQTAAITSLLSAGPWFKNLLTLDAENRIIHSKLDDINPVRNRTAEISYADYENKKGLPFATKRRIIVAERGRLEIRLDFKQYEFGGEQSFPFSVPKNYERN